ncbi:MAG: hypothetical protein KDC09_07920 [Bacteroidales bacterium]|nr:hypothetical protein [Bacteroidales bacterium]
MSKFNLLIIAWISLSPLFPFNANVSPQPTMQLSQEAAPGLGMFKPDFFNNHKLGFYGKPNFEKAPDEHVPYDSLLFEKTETGLNIAYAPPYFVPAIMKLDYEVLYLRVVSVKRDFYEVVVNEITGQTSYIDKYSGEIFYWPDFLLQVNSVIQIFPENNPVRTKGLAAASEVNTNYSFLHPISIKNDWMEVELLDDSFQRLETGWIRWQECGELLITFSLFS